tara:strand:+ start:212 stop:427 length:216 start_codon:yes stop_codon:yes gene_type:complete
MSKKEKNFKRLAEVRTRKVLYYLNLLSNLSNQEFYSYTEDQISKITGVIQSELRNLEKKFAQQEELNKFKL